MINLTIQNTIQSTIKNTLGNLSEKFITQLFVPVGSDSFITADNKIFKVRVDMSTLLYLFAEDQRGVWYDPSDLATMFQESTGSTAVTADGQPVGLMLDKSRGETDKLISNGTFDTDLSGWSSNNAINTWENGRLKHVDDGLNSVAYQLVSTVAGKSYIVSVDIEPISYSSDFFYLVVQPDQFVEDFVSYPRDTSIGLDATTLSLRFTATSTTTVIVLGSGVDNSCYFDNVSVKEVIGIPATQSTASQRPTYNTDPSRLTLDGVDDSLEFTVPAGGIDGYMVIGTNDGTASYGVSLPAGSYELGGDYFPSNTINGFLLREGDMSASNLSNVEKDFVSKGAKASYEDVTNFTNYWRDKGITEFPLIDTSSGTNFALAWRNNNLTSFPLIDTSSGTIFFGSWQDNNLTSFPLIDTSSGTNFFGTWWNNNLTSFPLIDTSNGTDFTYAWRNNSFTVFPLIDTSSGTNFYGAWFLNTSLADFPANVFDNCLATNFNLAFANTNLTQSSIDGILVSIESNGTSNGTFDQSGGSAPSATGEVAIDALRSRGWTVNVTGGY